VGLKFGDVKESRLLSYLRQGDLLVHVVRAFENDAVYHSAGDVDPLRDVKQMEEEMILADLIVLENRYEKLKKLVMMVKDPKDQLQLSVLEKIKPVLEDGGPLRNLNLTPEERKSIKGFGFVSMKPLQVVINIDESDIADCEKVKEKVSKGIEQNADVGFSHICAPVEEEIGKMNADDAKEFMDEYGLTRLGSWRLIQDSYELLGLISFLTIGDDECRSWAIRKGTKAVRAAGAVHTDIERGFIAAEVVKFHNFRETPSIQKLKQKGLVKIEGKEYRVEDGDLIDFRFNV